MRNLKATPINSNEKRIIAVVEDEEGRNTYVWLDANGIKENIAKFRENPLSKLTEEEISSIKEELESKK